MSTGLRRRLERIEAHARDRATVVHLPNGEVRYLPCAADFDCFYALITRDPRDPNAPLPAHLDLLARSLPQPAEGSLWEFIRREGRRLLEEEDRDDGS